MRITYKGDYALKTILSLSLNYGAGPLTIHQIAKSSDMPIKFLEQILLGLRRAGFVESRRGKIGGYILARHPAKITLGEIIRFIDGPIEPVACVDKKYRGCSDVKDCVFQEVWQRVTAATCGIIDHLSFEDLVKKLKKKDNALSYQI